MNNAKEIAEKIIKKYLVLDNVPSDYFILARTYLELENKYRMLNNAVAIASWNVNDYVKQFAKDIIEHSKSDSEITKLKEENEKLKKSHNVLRKAAEFYANCKEVKMLLEKSPENALLEAQLFGVSMNYVECKEGEKAREALKEDDEIMKGE